MVALCELVVTRRRPGSGSSRGHQFLASDRISASVTLPSALASRRPKAVVYRPARFTIAALPRPSAALRSMNVVNSLRVSAPLPSTSACPKFAGFAAAAGFPEGEFEPEDAFTINQNTPPVVDDEFYGG